MCPTTPYTQDQKAILDKFFSKFDGSFQDQAKYEKEYLPKVEKYLADLAAAQPDELKLSSEFVPESLDAVVDAFKVLHDSKALSEKELEITELGSKELLAKIASRELTSEEVFKAFAHRCIIANQLTNFALQVFLDEGLERAQYLDKYIAENGKTIGPLHGLPLSIKEHVAYKGKITHQSFVSLIDNVSPKGAYMLDIFAKLGCVYYVRTSQPQTIMHLDTDNNFIGRSRNPWNLALSPGGSSGGEGACVSLGGSPIGIGSDIGGSIRGPAAYCGIWGLKPTSRRTTGVPAPLTSGNESVVPTGGPLSRDIDGIELFMDTYLNEGKPWTVDAWALPFPWRKVETPKAKGLKVGILWDDGIVKPFPPIERGLKFVAEKLQAAGVEVVDFEPYKTQEAYDIVHSFYTLDGNASKRKILGKSGEPLKPLTKWYLSYGEGDKTLSFEEYHKMIVKRDVLRDDYLRLMNEQGLDFIISPASYNVAALPGKVFYWGYTSLWNIMDLPTLTFPTGLKQDPAIDTKIENYTPRNVYEELELPNYDDPSLFKNAPIALQLTGRRYNDEEVVAAGRLIGEILNV